MIWGKNAALLIVLVHLVYDKITDQITKKNAKKPIAVRENANINWSKIVSVLSTMAWTYEDKGGDDKNKRIISGLFGYLGE